MCKFSNMNRKRLVHDAVSIVRKVTRDCMDAEPYVVHVCHVTFDGIRWSIDRTHIRKEDRRRW